MERPVRQASWIPLVLCLASSPAFAESARAEAGSDSTLRIIVIPPLAGALSFELGPTGRFALADQLGELPGLGIGGTIGWRSFFDDYGRFSIRTYGLADRAGLGSSGTGAMWRLGGGAQFLFRGYTDDFVFGGWGFGAEAAFVRWNGLSEASRNGWQVTSLVELSVGQLFSSSPFTFGETSTAIGLSYTDVGPASGVSVELRWLIRFDWAFRRARYE